MAQAGSSPQVSLLEPRSPTCRVVLAQQKAKLIMMVNMTSISTGGLVYLVNGSAVSLVLRFDSSICPVHT